MAKISRDTNARRRAEAAGRRAERLALLALRLKGYRLVERRFRCPQGEIDLIMRRAHTLVFVEVKARGGAVEAAEAIGRRQRDRIVRAAVVFLQRRLDFASFDQRFDAVLVASGRWPRHLVGAWRGDDFD